MSMETVFTDNTIGSDSFYANLTQCIVLAS